MQKGKLLLVVVSLVAVVAIAFAAVFGVQKGDLQKQVADLEGQVTKLNAEIKTMKDEAAAAEAAAKAAAEAAEKAAAEAAEKAAAEKAAAEKAAAEAAKKFTYNDSVSTIATNWNPHTYQTTDDSYPADFIRAGLYTFLYNDELHPLEGKDPYSGYVIVPEMAASMPVDVTEQVKAEHPEFNIPESATKGFAYTIDLNPLCTWEDGTPINADTYVESMKRLLDPKLLNYRASDYTDSDFSIANGLAYANAGKTVYADNGLAGDAKITSLDALTKGEDGQYAAADGDKMYIGLDIALDWTSGSTLKSYVEKYGEEYFSLGTWEELSAKMKDGVVPLTDENIALFLPVITGNPAWGETEDNLFDYLAKGHEYGEMAWENVGIYKTGDYQITLVLAKSLSGFYLNYNLSGNWIVKTDLYDACLKETDGVWTSTYNTSVETTSSFGPYKMTSYQTDKQIVFEKNENWYGWTDGKHVYVDPTDGETYPMFQTTKIVCDVVAESSTRRQMFLNGQLMTYGLQAEDMETYRSSDYCYASPSETIFFMILNGYTDMLNSREAADDFDTATLDLQTMGLQNFRKALAVSYDRDDMCAKVSPARSGGYGIIGTNYISDPEQGTKYRETEQGMKALCDFYSVDTTKYPSLKEAVASITGYDPVAAKELFTLAFADAIAAGYITDADNDGISDQTVQITYAISSDSDFMTKTIAYLNENAAKAAEGTPFAGKIAFVKSAPLGNDWSNQIRAGQMDTVLGGWSGSAMNPYGLTDLYVNPARAYDAQWFDGNKVEMTVAIDGTDVTMTLKNWSDALNGTVVTVNGVDYNFGADQAEMEVRLNILAAFEGAVLQTYDYLPMLQDGGMSLLTQKAFYVIEDYNPVMGRGGITYLKYNYNDAEWDAYVAEQGGTLTY